MTGSFIHNCFFCQVALPRDLVVDSGEAGKEEGNCQPERILGVGQSCALPPSSVSVQSCHARWRCGYHPRDHQVSSPTHPLMSGLIEFYILHCSVRQPLRGAAGKETRNRQPRHLLFMIVKETRALNDPLGVIPRCQLKVGAVYCSLTAPHHSKPSYGSLFAIEPEQRAAHVAP